MPDPIERLWRRVAAGEIGVERARALTAEPEVMALLTPPYVRALCDHLERLAVDRWTDAVTLHGLVRSAVDAHPDAAEMRPIVDLGWIGVVTGAVGHVPDGRLMRDAVRRGEALLAAARDVGDRALEGETLHRLGVLHLDPYVAGRSSSDLPGAIARWQRRVHEHYGDEIAGVAAEELAVPPANEAFARAESLLRDAAALRVGDRRARSLKALAEVMTWRGVLGEPTDRAAVVATLREALALFDPATAPMERATIMAHLHYQDEPVDEAALDALLDVPLAESVERMGELAASELARQTIALATDARPERALALAVELEPLLDTPGRDERRASLWMQQLRLLRRVHAPATLGLPQPLPPLPLLTARVAELAEQQRWDDETVGATLLVLAMLSPDGDQEAAGLHALREAERRAPALAALLPGAFGYLASTLHTGTAVNLLNAGRAADAVLAYAAGLRAALAIGSRTLVTDLLARLHSLHDAEDPDVVGNLVAALSDVAVGCEALVGEPATRVVQDTCRELLRRIAGGGTVNPTLVTFLLCVAKGLRFAAALAAPEPYRWDEDAEGVALLERVEAARAAAVAAGEGDDDVGAEAAALNDSLFLAAYIGPGERHEGATAREVHENLQQVYDAHVGRRLLDRARASLALFPTPETLQAALDDRTVLVDYYLGTAPDGSLAIYITALTRESVWMTYGRSSELPSGHARLSYEGREVVVTLQGMAVQGVLRDVVAEPWGGVVDAAAAASLKRAAHDYFGTFRQRLDELRAAGKDHLCIVPHGPLHYFPFHLVGDEDAPLAADWIVTYLPNLRLLTRPPAARRDDDVRAVAAIGLTFAHGGTDGGVALPEVADEVRAVAAPFGETPLVDDAATASAVADALQRARWAHLATHGRHALSAPAFQKLYVTPDDTGDGELCAYEVLGLDLTRLDILTLSACETALGRFDAGDNLRGLPASFLLAGARAVVGTLWPVETNASAHFFTTFYEALHAAAAPLDAFAVAQRATRSRFPAYRDWGAFHFSGDWRPAAAAH